ncbi:MAG: Gfo/Idh/MocA family oxidoreductase [Phycisphaeraceae bacterium]|nr:Gfo/Idh/MocA family oxidoreductase [Phycisphaeraceae bacterium]
MKPLKIALIGCGGIMSKHSRVFKARPDCKIVALHDVTLDRVRAFMDKQLADVAEKPSLYTDLDKLYAETKPDAVVIATPHTLHYEQAVQALDHGCHILMEKPMVTQADHAHDLAKRVEKSKKIFVVGYNTPCSPEFDYIRQTIKDKTFGKLELITGYLSQNWKKFTIGSWRQDPKLSGGGQANDSGAHLLNSLCWTVDAPIAEVFAFVDNVGTPVDINSSIAIKFANGVLASIAVSGNCPSDGSHMVYMFENGRIEVDGWGAAWMNVFGPNGKIKYPKVTTEPQTPADNFIDAILGKTAQRTMPRNGIIQSELMEAIYESARTGKPAKPKNR